MPTPEPAAQRARRWFWALVALAVLSTGGVYRALHTASGAATALLFLSSSLVLAASTLQAARILNRLAGPPRTPGRRHRSARTRQDGSR